MVVTVECYWQSWNTGIFSEILVVGTEPDVPDVSDEEEEAEEEEKEGEEDDVKDDTDDEV